MNLAATTSSAGISPILIVPYMWIGDFVRCHTVAQLLNARFPDRPVDMLATPLTAPLADYMPGVRKAVVSDLPRGRLALGRQRALAQRLRGENYGTALIMPRTWKSALAPFLAGIPERTGFFGEARLVLLNDVRWGERALKRMTDRCSALALPRDAPLPAAWPLPELVVPDADVMAWREKEAIDERTAVAMCPGAVGPGKSWPVHHYATLAQRLTADGISVWVLGAPSERPLAQEIAAAGGALVRDLTGPLRDNVFALKAASAAVTNDSGLLHVAAAIGTPAVAIFGPTDPRLHAPLNPVAAIIEPEGAPADHRQTADVPVEPVEHAVRVVLARSKSAASPSPGFHGRGGTNA